MSKDRLIFKPVAEGGGLGGPCPPPWETFVWGGGENYKGDPYEKGRFWEQSPHGDLPATGLSLCPRSQNQRAADNRAQGRRTLRSPIDHDGFIGFLPIQLPSTSLSIADGAETFYAASPGLQSHWARLSGAWQRRAKAALFVPPLIASWVGYIHFLAHYPEPAYRW